MLLGRLRIRGKLALLVVIPLLSMVALAGPVVADRFAAAGRASDTAELVRVASRVGSLVQQIQQERLMSVGYLLGVVARTDLAQKSATVTDLVADVRAEFGADLPARVSPALDNVRRLVDLRPSILARRATPAQIMDTFGPIDVALIDSLRLAYDVDTRTTTGRQVLALDFLLRADEGLSIGATLTILTIATKSQWAISASIANLAALQVSTDKFRALATPDQYALGLSEDAAVAARTSKDFLTLTMLDPVAALAGQTVESIYPASRSMITLGQFVEKKVAVDVIAEATGQQRRALVTAYGVGVLALFILVVVIGLSVLVGRTVAGPLTRLTRSADRVARLAEEELVQVADDEAESTSPVRLDPVDIRARDEVGDLARAFDRVQSTAARLVERQVASRRNVAQMFGHVGRRTQNLVGRQLSLIDRLEHHETDPTRLQHLYRLDHVSSRLRRNASSLVVLSGSAGSDTHVAPLPLADVVRLALGEIEAYTRVDVRVPPEITIAPAVIGDLVLMLAELMENATAFSPPHTRVTVTADREMRGAWIRLVDHGIGLPEERMAEENARLTQRERLDLAPTEVLGLFVVGRLARRHGWLVELSPTAGGGVTVDVGVCEPSLIHGHSETIVTAVARVAVAPASGDEAGDEAPAEPPTRQLLALGPATPTEVRPTPPAFDVALLSRATRSLESGQPWNAFVTDPAGTEESLDQPPAVIRSRPVAVKFRPGAEPQSAVPETEPAEPERSSLRQRVPGTQLPTVGPTQFAAGATRADPRRVRALIEEFEAGVRRAERGFAAPTHTSQPVEPPLPELRQRVPGASLSPAAPATRITRQPTTSHPADPEEVRTLITQFESGVARALSEISSTNRNEEGQP